MRPKIETTDLEVLPEFPAAALLFSTGGTIMGQISVRVVIEKSGHLSLAFYRRSLDRSMDGVGAGFAVS